MLALRPGARGLALMAGSSRMFVGLLADERKQIVCRLGTLSLRERQEIDRLRSTVTDREAPNGTEGEYNSPAAFEQQCDLDRRRPQGHAETKE